MIHSAFDPMDIAGLHQWMQQQAGDNSQRRQRLLLQDEPRGHRPCSRFASAQRCSPGACADSPA